LTGSGIGGLPSFLLFESFLFFFFGDLLFEYFDFVFVVGEPVAVLFAGEAVAGRLAGVDGFSHFESIVVVAERADRFTSGGGAPGKKTLGDVDAVEIGAGFLLRDAFVAESPEGFLYAEKATVGVFKQGHAERRAGAGSGSVDPFLKIAMAVAEDTVMNQGIGTFASG
jgi:hypothetical protein